MYGLEALNFNMKDGYLGACCNTLNKAEHCWKNLSLPPYIYIFICNTCIEAIVRGHKGSLLTTVDYNNLCQCETLDDIKLHLVRLLKYSSWPRLVIAEPLLGEHGLWAVSSK